MIDKKKYFIDGKYLEEFDIMADDKESMNTPLDSAGEKKFSRADIS